MVDAIQRNGRLKGKDYPVLTCARLVVVLRREKASVLAPPSPMDPFPRLESRSSSDSRRTVPSKGFVRVGMDGRVPASPAPCKNLWKSGKKLVSQLPHHHHLDVLFK